jgi:hypothetical protein
MTEQEIGELYRAGWANNMDFARVIEAKVRDEVLEEVAKEFDSMRIAFGDTAHSFAQYVREMKNAKT